MKVMGYKVLDAIQGYERNENGGNLESPQTLRWGKIMIKVQGTRRRRMMT